MKTKLLFYITFVLVGNYFSSAQQVTFNGCQSSLGNQNYVMTFVIQDVVGRNMYSTSSSVPCPAGDCILRVEWNMSQVRWEIILDNNGTESVLYWNTAFSLPGPPDETLGVWVDVLSGMPGECGAFLAEPGSLFTGDVQPTIILSIDDFSKERNKISVYPNPVEDVIEVNVVENVAKIRVFDVMGKVVLEEVNKKSIDVLSLKSGVYIVELTLEGEQSAPLFRRVIKK